MFFRQSYRILFSSSVEFSQQKSTSQNSGQVVSQKSTDVLLEKQSSRQNSGFRHETEDGMKCFSAQCFRVSLRFAGRILLGFFLCELVIAVEFW